MHGAAWAEDELASAGFGDRRLDRRFIQIVSQLAASPGASIPQACRSWSSTKACYNFMSSAKVTPGKILGAHQQRVRQRSAQQKMILAVQDTTLLDFTHHPKTSGLGYLNHAHRRGILVNTALGITPQGEPIGVLAQQAWVQPIEQLGKHHQRKKRPTADKQTQRWLDVQQQAIDALAADVAVVTIADREGDFWEFLSAPRAAANHVLVRVAQNRRVLDAPHYLRAAIEEVPPMGCQLLEVQRCNKRSHERPARVARLAISYTQLCLCAPENRAKADCPQSLAVNLVLAREIAPPSGEPGIEWLLLTTLPVGSMQQALQCVEYYSRRWLVERFHYTLKSGCGVEQLQLEHVERLINAVALLSIVAWRLMYVLYHARLRPEASAAEVFETAEWQMLYLSQHHAQPPPPQPPTLGEAVRLLAKMGGFLARRGDKQPGIKTLWRGLRRLHDRVDAVKLALQLPYTYG